jgi:hypothetical protein
VRFPRFEKSCNKRRSSRAGRRLSFVLGAKQKLMLAFRPWLASSPRRIISTFQPRHFASAANIENAKKQLHTELTRLEHDHSRVLRAVQAAHDASKALGAEVCPSFQLACGC